jgi:DNA/RNA-binding domain of Phe-tRNA-synthetase-like protein
LGKLLRGVQTLEDLIEVAERELGEIVVEWRALLRMLGVDPRKARYVPGEST